MTSKQEEFLKKHYNYAKKAGEKYKINPLFLLAQCYTETGGNSKGLIIRKNPGSITSRRGDGSKTAYSDYWKGADSQSSVSKLWFRVYATFQNGWYDFARLLASKYNVAGVNSIETYADRLSRSKYISESVGDDRALYKRNILAAYKWVKTFEGIEESETKNYVLAGLSVAVLVGIIAYVNFK